MQIIPELPYLNEIDKLNAYIEKRPSWDAVHFTSAVLWAQRSIDTSSQVGCVITTYDHVPLAHGYNGPIRGVNIHDPYVQQQITTRPDKYQWMEHGERNAIFNALRNVVGVKDAVLYILGIPCTDCCRAICQSGIDTVKVLNSTHEVWVGNAKWAEKNQVALNMFIAAEVNVKFVDTKLVTPLPLRINGVTYLVE